MKPRLVKHLGETLARVMLNFAKVNSNPWLESLGVLALAGMGVLLGILFSRLPKLYWTLGYFIPLTLIVTYGTAMRFHALGLIPPFSWLMAGRVKFAIIGILTTLVLTTPLSRLRFPSARVLVCLLMLVATAKLSFCPFLAPAFNRERLSHLQTRLDVNGICRQSTDYTCGPAAAVTALRKFGFPADEGQIAILAHTTSVIGTPPDILADALREQYGHQGLSSQYRVLRNVTDLKDAGLTLAVMKYRAWVDHYVVVLEVTNSQVVVGDPLLGLRMLSDTEFERMWRFEGVVLTRTR